MIREEVGMKRIFGDFDKAYVAYLHSSTKEGKAPRTRRQRAEAISPRELRWLLAHKPEKLDQRSKHDSINFYRYRRTYKPSMPAKLFANGA